MRFTRTVTISAIALCGLSAGALQATAQPLTINFGWSTMPAHMIVAYFEGPDEIFRHRGESYEINTVSFSGSTHQITALAAGEIDFGLFSGTALALSVLNAGLDTKVVADNLQDGIDGWYSQSFFVKTDSGIDSVSDLAGQTIGVNAIGSASDTMLRAALIDADMNPETDVNIIEVSFANMPAMIEDDRVDAASLPQPIASQMVESGDYKKLFSSVDVMGPTGFTFAVARGDFLEENRDVLYDFFEDYVRAHQWFTDPDNREEALAILAEVSLRPLDGVQHLFTEIDYFRDPYLFPNPEGIQTTIDLAVQLDILPQAIQVEPNHVDLSFVEEAQRRIDADE